MLHVTSLQVSDCINAVLLPCTEAPPTNNTHPHPRELARLIDSGKPTMIPRERSIAIRSLLATADTEDRSSALDRAIGDVEMLRV